jgi:hypothetical protein
MERPQIADNVSEYSHYQSEMSYKIASSSVNTNSAPSPYPQQFTKLPTARDLVTEAVF